MSNEYRVRDKMRRWHRGAPLWVSYATVLAVLAIWESVSHSGLVSSLFLPAPSQIGGALVFMAVSGELMTNVMASLYRIFWGFLLGGSLGLLVGLSTGISALLDRMGTPLVNALYPIPKIALLPLFILWLGIGEVSKVTIIALGVFFPIAINTYAGVKNTDPLLLKVAASFNAGRMLVLRSIVLPQALPLIFAGFRLAAGTSLLLLVAAEMIAAEEGLGALILHYGDLMITSNLMAGVVVLSLLGLLFNSFFRWLERRTIRWNHRDM